MSLAHAAHKELSTQRLSSDRHGLERSKLKKQNTSASIESQKDTSRISSQTHRSLVFCDPVAFRYLEDDDSCVVQRRWVKLQGYELYIVEQWVCSRTRPTFVICTYTGDTSHSILVNVLAIPRDEQEWSPRLRIYFQAVSQFHAREQETPLGTLVVSNLSAFPSSLTVISVPDGDVKLHREDFIVNEDLKRMGCAGRAAMTLSDPAASTLAKYHHLYHVSDAVPLHESVIELVKLCQTALVLYGKLKPLYVDGLLCDLTEQAISEWWNDIGTEFHNVEPSDGIFGPTTVAALLGLWVGAYNRLKAAGVNVSKDVLNLLSMKRAIGHFQKANKMNKTRRLDRETLDRLHRTTAKSASGEGWTVPRAVKSTVAELSGKGGEMVMGFVGAKEKAGISDIETLDIEQFAQLVPAGKLKWLWQGKRMKTTSGFDAKGLGYNEDGTYLWPGGKTLRHEDEETDTAQNQSAGEGKLRRLRGTVPKLRSHAHRSHKYDHDSTDTEDESEVTRYQKPHDHLLRSPSSLKSRPSSVRQDSKPALNLALAIDDAPTTPPPHASNRLQPIRKSTDSTVTSHRQQLRGLDRVVSESPGKKKVKRELEFLRKEVEADRYQNFATEFDDQSPDSTALRRSKSALRAHEVDLSSMRFLNVPRRLSFGLVESTLRIRKEDDVLDSPPNNDTELHPSLQVSVREAEMTELKEHTANLLRLEHSLLPYAELEVEQVAALDDASQQTLTELNNFYYMRLEEYQNMQAMSTDLIAREKAMLNDDLRRIDGLGAKLDYELDLLASRMQEVEDSTMEFERNVLEIEARLAELVKEKPKSQTGTSGNNLLQRFLIFLSGASGR